MKKTAELSECTKYRWTLGRDWSDEGGPYGGHLLWVMLNPSTADAHEDDATIRKCVGFSQRWGYAHLTVVNLYGYRATDPKELRRVADPVGISNWKKIEEQIVALDRTRGDELIVAWGAGAGRAEQATFAALTKRLEWVTPCLGLTLSGAPRHPLYVRYDAKLDAWTGPR